MNACLTCGACCAAFRVDFHRAELATGRFPWGPGVAPEMTVPVTADLVRMVGSDDFPPRCCALRGEVGRGVTCSIYDARPSPCREFEPGHAACTRARRSHGLPGL